MWRIALSRSLASGGGEEQTLSWSPQEEPAMWPLDLPCDTHF